MHKMLGELHCVFHYWICLDDSDNPTGESCHFPRRLMVSGGEKRSRRDDSIPDNDQETEKLVNLGKWIKSNPGLVGTKIPKFHEPVTKKS